MRKLLLILALLMVIPLSSAQANPVVEFSPSDVDSQFKVNQSQRACYLGAVGTNVQITNFQVQKPSGTILTPEIDSEQCVAFLVDEPGKWQVIVTTQQEVPLGADVVKVDKVIFNGWDDVHPTTLKDQQTYELQQFIGFFVLFAALWVFAEWKKDVIYYFMALLSGAYLFMNIPEFVAIPSAIFVSLLLWIGAQGIVVINKGKRNIEV